MRHIVEWGWVHAFIRLGEDSLVITDSEFLKRLKKLSSNYKCHFTTRDALDRSNLKQYKNILVFLRQGELRLLNELKVENPEINIVSGIHEFSLVSKERAARLKLIRSPLKSNKARPIVFLATPNSGAEFFAEQMGRNGLLQPWEYVGRPFVSLANLYQDIDFFEIIKNTESRYKADEGMAYLFQTDVLEALFSETSLTQEQFVTWLREQNAHVVTFTRTDRFNQAFITGMLKTTFTRSVWTMRTKQDFKFKFQNENFLHILQAFYHIDAGEELLERISANLPDTHSVLLSKALEDPVKALTNIVQHVMLTLPEGPELLDYKNSFWQKTAMQRDLHAVRHNLIDRFGLHVQPFVH